MEFPSSRPSKRPRSPSQECRYAGNTNRDVEEVLMAVAQELRMPYNPFPHHISLSLGKRSIQDESLPLAPLNPAFHQPDGFYDPRRMITPSISWPVEIRELKCKNASSDDDDHDHWEKPTKDDFGDSHQDHHENQETKTAQEIDNARHFHIQQQQQQRVSVFDRLNFPKEQVADHHRSLEEEGSLRGMIFGCTCDTKEECERLRLFGLPGSNKDNVLRVVPGTQLFLFNYDTKELSGVYEAKSHGAMNIMKAAFQEWGSFPAQVKVRKILDCPELPLTRFRNAIAENFYAEKRFRYDLSQDQVEKLLTLFLSARDKQLNS